ncbi:MAG: hypothetical protein AMXMBFR47_22010 [Planctomycetota bacterium]
MLTIRKILAIALIVTLPAAVAGQEPGANSLKPLAKGLWDRDAAAHLLARAGFGGTPEEIERLSAMGVDEAVSYLVDFKDLPYACPEPAIADELMQPPNRQLLRSMTEEERRKAEESRRRLERTALEETRAWWIERMLTSPRPFEEKMTLFWHGRFTSGVREVRNPVFMKEQNDLFRKNGLGNFKDLVLAVSRDRAMLVYLDGNRNNKSKPNENYARELMELFTLGVGNYSEADIKEAARAFTGWQFDEDGFVFRGRNHDYGPKKFLGKTGKFNGEDIVEIILDQPACSRFLATKILEFFVRPDPPKPLVDALAAELRKNKFELRPTMATLFRSQAFYHPDSRGALVKSPVELIVGTARRLGVPINNLVVAERAMAQMGQELLQPPNVKGWDGHEKWINAATLFQRYNAVGAIINGGAAGPNARARIAAAVGASSEDDDKYKDDEMMKMGDTPAEKSRLAGRAQPAFDPMPVVRANSLKSAEDLVDYFSRFLLPRPLHTAKREQLIAYLLDGKPSFDPAAKGAETRIRTMVHLLCSTPEYQMN